MWAPPVINWFINPSNYSYLRTINHSYWSYVHQLSYRLGAPLCMIWLCLHKTWGAKDANWDVKTHVILISPKLGWYSYCYDMTLRKMCGFSKASSSAPYFWEGCHQLWDAYKISIWRFPIHRGTPSIIHHFSGIFPEINHPAIGVPPF